MHGLPNGSTRYVLFLQCFPNLSGSNRAGLINQHARKPKVGLTISTKGIHRNRQIFESLFIGFIDLPLLLDMFIQVDKLSSTNTSNNVAHAVVVPYFTVLIVRSRVSCLGCPESYFFYCLFVI